MPNPRFDREDDNLVTQYEITPAQAALGCEVLIETLDKKKVSLKVPAGISYGTRLRIPGEGVRRRGNFGSLLVRIVIATPKKLSSAERELYEQLLAAEGNAPKGRRVMRRKRRMRKVPGLMRRRRRRKRSAASLNNSFFCCVSVFLRWCLCCGVLLSVFLLSGFFCRANRIVLMCRRHCY